MSSAGNRDEHTRDAGDRSAVVTNPTGRSAQQQEPAGAESDTPSGQASDDGEFEMTSTPPWQRVQGVASSDGHAGRQPGWPGQPQNSAPEQPLATGSAAPRILGDRNEQASGRMSFNLGTAAGAGSVPAGEPRAGRPSALRRPGRGPRRASLHVKRVDPWSVLKLSLVLAIAMFFVWMVAVGVLYGVLDGMGVWDKLNGTYSDLVSSAGNTGGGPLISAGRVFGITAIIGVINIILFTALATVGTFVYNVAADLAGGLEVTLAERE